MKRKIMLLMLALLIVMTLAGCGESVKTEAALQEDLLANSSFHMINGSEVADFSVIKRLTDEPDRTDTVYVKVKIDHPAATADAAYVMHYTCYNDGWMLDSVEEYHGQEVEWKTVPKNDPTNEEIMRQLIANSNAAIDDFNREWNISNAYFFEEGKYAAQICSGDRTSNQTYECIVVTERIYDYVKVEETQKLSFVFDMLSYEWVLYDVKVIDISGNWYVGGYWREPSSGATILLERKNEASYSIDNAYEVFSGSCIPSAENTDFEIQLYLPSSRGSYPGGSSGYVGSAFGYVNFYLFVFPTEVRTHDNALLPIQLDARPSALETTGIIDMRTEEGAAEYREMAKLLLSSAFIDLDTSYANAVWHPLTTQIGLSELEETVKSGHYQVLGLTHGYSQVVRPGDVEWENINQDFKSLGIKAEEIAVSMYFAEIATVDGTECEWLQVYLAKENEQIYVILVE